MRTDRTSAGAGRVQQVESAAESAAAVGPDVRDEAEALLCDVERHLAAVDDALIGNAPQSLQAAAVALRSSALTFGKALEVAFSAEAFDAAIRRRIDAVAERLRDQRAALARRNALVERTLAVIMRVPDDATYGRPGARKSVFAGAGNHSLGAH